MALRSSVDPQGRAYDLDNQRLADASVFLASAATNPTLMIVANAFRVAGYLASDVLG
ncbi:GMC oxidoreductase [Rubrivirga sp.]|uniref:GMC oxidoreductase n=1 Tax=Rubrivirga sp. TaxID=1885344 RepID=UPI003B523E74